MANKKYVLKRALEFKIKYQDLNYEYKRLCKQMQNIRARKIQITKEKDKVFNKMSEQMEILANEFE